MITLGILLTVIILGIVAFVMFAVALPIFAVFLIAGLVLSIIAMTFKLVFGLPGLIIIIVLAIIYFSKNQNRL